MDKPEHDNCFFTLLSASTQAPWARIKWLLTLGTAVSWQTLSSGLVSGWNNMSINSYLTSGSTTFTIKFTRTGDNAQNTWQVASALIRPESNQDLFFVIAEPGCNSRCGASAEWNHDLAGAKHDRLPLKRFLFRLSRQSHPR